MHKTLYLVHFGSIFPVFEQNWILIKILFVSVFLILTKYHCAKFQKNVMSGFQATLAPDGRTDTQISNH